MIIIRPQGGQTIADVIRLLRDLADDTSTVRTGGGGVIVDEELAYDYLTAVLRKGPVARLDQLAVDPAAHPTSLRAPQDPAPSPRPPRRQQPSRKRSPGGVS